MYKSYINTLYYISSNKKMVNKENITKEIMQK